MPVFLFCCCCCCCCTLLSLMMHCLIKRIAALFGTRDVFGSSKVFYFHKSFVKFHEHYTVSYTFPSLFQKSLFCSLSNTAYDTLFFFFSILLIKIYEFHLYFQHHMLQVVHCLSFLKHSV